MDLYTISIILFIFFLILLSGFFSGTETALTAVSKPKIHQLEKSNPRAKIVSFLKLQKEKLIGTLLLGNNLVNTLATAIATSLIINYSNNSEKAVIYSTCIMTALILIFGEVLPKTVAINKAEILNKIFVILFILYILLLYMLLITQQSLAVPIALFSANLYGLIHSWFSLKKNITLNMVTK